MFNDVEKAGDTSNASNETTSAINTATTHLCQQHYQHRHQ